MEATRAPAKRITVGNVINETFSIYGQNAVSLIASAIVVFVIVGVAAALLQNTGGLVLGVLAGIVQLAGTRSTPDSWSDSCRMRATAGAIRPSGTSSGRLPQRLAP